MEEGQKDGERGTDRREEEEDGARGKRAKAGAASVTEQTDGALGSSHHLYSNARRQEGPKVSQLANGSERDPPIRTEDTKINSQLVHTKEIKATKTFTVKVVCF